MIKALSSSEEQICLNKSNTLEKAGRFTTTHWTQDLDKQTNYSELKGSGDLLPINCSVVTVCVRTGSPW